jgi:MoxR-like ATPase
MLSIDTIASGLAGIGYVLDRGLAVRMTGVLATKPQAGAFLRGPAGSGKTFLAEASAQLLDAQLCYQQCFPGTREDDLMIKIVPSEKTTSGVEAIDGSMLEACAAVHDGHKAVLLLDEWDKTRPSADAFLLDFLQSGRIRYNGRSVALAPEERGRLTVFLTLNDERNLSEPLLRRLPMIEFDYLPASTVLAALNATHAGHLLVGACVALYQRTLAAKLDKPATIQELRQLMDAATACGAEADWDELVRLYVTKGAADHETLKRAEGAKLEPAAKPAVVLDTAAYAAPTLKAEPPVEAPRKPVLPGAWIDAPMVRLRDQPVLNKAVGIFELSDNAHDRLIDFFSAKPGKAGTIGDRVTIEGEVLVVRGDAFSLADLEGLSHLARSSVSGEVLLHVAEATMADVLELRVYKSGYGPRREFICTHYTKAEIRLRHEKGMQARWTSGGGLEIVLPIKAADNLQSLISRKTWGEAKVKADAA